MVGATVLALLVVAESRAVAAPGKCEVAFIVDPLCEAGKTAVGTASDVVEAPFRFATTSAVDAVTSWVADTAQWIVGRTVRFIEDSTSPRLNAEWFTERFRFMVGLGALVMLPLLLLASIRAVLDQDVGQLLRSFFLYLPIAAIGTFMAIGLTDALLRITDSLSAAVADGVARDTSQIFDSAGSTLADSVGGFNPGLPSFAVFLGGVLLIVGAFLVWLELLVRSAAVTVAVFFLPVILAALVWPATMRWTRRLIEMLVALILSKFVIVAVISLATAALSQPDQGGFGTVMGGAALMLMAAFSPFVLLRLMPAVEASAIDHLDRVGRTPIRTVSHSAPVNHVVSIMKSKVGSSTVAGAGASGMPATMAVTRSSAPATAVDASVPSRSKPEASGATRPSSKPPLRRRPDGGD